MKQKNIVKIFLGKIINMEDMYKECANTDTKIKIKKTYRSTKNVYLAFLK